VSPSPKKLTANDLRFLPIPNIRNETERYKLISTFDYYRMDTMTNDESVETAAGSKRLCKKLLNRTSSLIAYCWSAEQSFIKGAFNAQSRLIFALFLSNELTC
jgi:hypothetical protein